MLPTIAALALCAAGHAQNPWLVGGNSDTNNDDLIGTTGNKSIAIGTNNTAHLKIAGNGNLLFPQFAGIGSGLLYHNNNGRMLSLLFPGDSTQLLAGDGNWRSRFSLMPELGYWTKAGNTLSTAYRLSVTGLLHADSISASHLSVDQFHVTGPLRVGTNSINIISDVGFGHIYNDDGPMRIQSQSSGSEHDPDLDVFINLNSGRVGIGTDEPAEKLDVDGNALVHGFLQADSLRAERISADELLVYDWAIEAEGDFHIVRPGDPASFVITSDDNVGIGTDAPEERLDVHGSAIVRGTLLADSISTEKLGIGTDSPEERLDVHGNAIVRGTLQADSISVERFSADELRVTDSLMVGTSTIVVGGDMFGNRHHLYANNGALVLQSRGQYVAEEHDPVFDLIANSNNHGRMGIGTASPESKLHVKGVHCPSCHQGSTPAGLTTHITIESLINDDTGNPVANSKWQLAAMSPEDRFFIAQPGQPSNVFTVTSDQKVGIGTVPPEGAIGDYRLFVEDGIATREVLVKTGDWPDFVFAPEYELMTLQELRAYLATNRHLPGIPSAAEVEANGGVALGDLQARLLKVVEEQALYILRLQENLEGMEQRIKVLEASQH